MCRLINNFIVKLKNILFTQYFLIFPLFSEFVSLCQSVLSGMVFIPVIIYAYAVLLFFCLLNRKWKRLSSVPPRTCNKCCSTGFGGSLKCSPFLTWGWHFCSWILEVVYISGSQFTSAAIFLLFCFISWLIVSTRAS